MLGLSIPEVAGRARTARDAATLALVARMSVAPGEARIGLIDALVRALKDAGVWAKLDLLYLMAAHDAQAARVNWVSAGFALTPVNAPAFTTDRGYAGDGATSYLDSGYQPGVSAGVAAQDRCHLGVWSRTEANANVTEIGSSNVFIQARSSGNFAGRMMSGTSVSNAVPSSIGHFAMTRSDAANCTAYRNGAALATSAAASLTPGAQPLYLGARRTSSGPIAFSTRQIAAAHAGAGLSAGDMAALYGAVGAYLTGVGAA